MRRALLDAAQALGGELVGENVPYSAVSTDSRTLPAGALFVALRGPNFDGGEFVAAAAARGAAGAVVEKAVPVAVPQIIVPDALLALQQLGAAWRASFDMPVVAVAGSNGKTTTKGMIASILSRLGPCLATLGNLNNHIGVPLTLMRLEAEHRSAVVELGADRVGEVAVLVKLARPTVGLITNAGAEHLEFFIDMDGVAKGEGEMVAGLAPDATAIINADDVYAGYWRGVATAERVVTFGIKGVADGRPASSRPADFTARQITQSIADGEFTTRFVLVCPLGERPIVLKAGGTHNIVNALAAAAAAAAAGATLDHIEGGLADFRAVAGRLQLKAGRNASWIIDDSYNANPSSVRAGIDVLRSLEGPTWLVMGDMAELGEHTAANHAEMGAYARENGVQRLFAVGAQSTHAVESFGAGGEWFADAAALTGRVQAELAPGVTLLVKGSRVNRLERVVQALVKPAGGAGAAGAVNVAGEAGAADAVGSATPAAASC
jgi:UDP-N-acetylmuramoyl-tripeptide--D-alanyl-D-alanine ligase